MAGKRAREVKLIQVVRNTGSPRPVPPARLQGLPVPARLPALSSVAPHFPRPGGAVTDMSVTDPSHPAMCACGTCRYGEALAKRGLLQHPLPSASSSPAGGEAPHECEFEIALTMGYMGCECGRTRHRDECQPPAPVLPVEAPEGEDAYLARIPEGWTLLKTRRALARWWMEADRLAAALAASEAARVAAEAQREEAMRYGVGRPNLKYAAFFRVVAYLMAENERLRAGGFNGR